MNAGTHQRKDDGNREGCQVVQLVLSVELVSQQLENRHTLI